MAYSLRKIEDKAIWDAFVASQAQYTFLHAFAYGEMQRELGDRVWRFGIWHEEKLRGVILVIKIHARRGDFLFVPHGPILIQNSPAEMVRQSAEAPAEKFKIFEALIGELKEIARKEKATFIRISPLLENSQENQALFHTLGFRGAPIHMHPEITWTLSLDKSEQELLRDMRKTTRNLIGRAEREGVEIRVGSTENDLEQFYGLYMRTAAKQHFVPFSRAYLSAELKTFGQEGSAIVLGLHSGKVQAGAFIVFYGDAGFYHHGASSLENPKIPVPYLVQWAAIQEAKKRGKKLYNFWGIVPQENTDHPWAGLSLFKMGFGGFRTDYLHAQDLPLSWKYHLNWAVETMRRRRRRY